MADREIDDERDERDESDDTERQGEKRFDGGASEGVAVTARDQGRGFRASLRDRSPLAYFSRLNRYDLLASVIYALALVFFVFPVFWIVSISVRPEGALFTYPIELLPDEITFAAYGRVLDAGMITWLSNSLVISITSVVGIVLVTTPAAYAFSRFRFQGRRPLLFTILLFQMISPIVTIIPLYAIMAQLNLLESQVGIVLLYVGLQIPFSLWLLKGYFDTVPIELDRAARIDGCNRFQTLRHVLLRPVAPGIAVIAIFNFVLTWSEFVMAYTVLGTETSLYTVSIGVYNFQGQYGSDWQAIAAASVVGMIPMVVLFIGLQRYFVSGLVRGGVKG